MSLYQGDYLRVMTPETTDGMTPVIGLDGRVVYRQDDLPLSIQKELEKENLKLPMHLRKKIEVVRTQFGPAVTPQPTQTRGKLR